MGPEYEDHAGNELVDLTDEEDSTSSSSDTADTALITAASNELRKKMRRRMYYRRAKPFPKIFKSDIRRTFSQMWVNVWNWQSPLDYSTFLHHFFSKNVIARFEYEPGVAEAMIKHFPFATEANSTHKSAQNFAYMSSVTVDAATTMQACQIKRSSDAKCTQIFMKITATGTIMYDLNLPKQLQDNGEEGFNMPIDPQEIRKYRVAAGQAVQVDGTGMLIFDIDEYTHYITQAVYRGFTFNATPLPSP